MCVVCLWCVRCVCGECGLMCVKIRYVRKLCPTLGILQVSFTLFSSQDFTALVESRAETTDPTQTWLLAETEHFNAPVSVQPGE